MPTVVTVVDIGATPEAVLSVLLDAEAAPIWTRDLERLELVHGVVGEAGSVGLAHYGEGRRRYTLQGRLIAARVQQLAGPGEIVISADMYKQSEVADLLEPFDIEEEAGPWKAWRRRFLSSVSRTSGG